jgi:hypothetical protein
MDPAAEKCVLSRQQRPERMGFARLRGFFGYSIRGLVPDDFTMSWHPLEAEGDVPCSNLGGCLEDRMDDSLPRSISHVLD